jgi:hypothetical protein
MDGARPARITSRVASTVRATSPLTISTPLARSASKRTLVAWVFKSRVRLGRPLLRIRGLPGGLERSVTRGAISSKSRSRCRVWVSRGRSCLRCRIQGQDWIRSRSSGSSSRSTPQRAAESEWGSRFAGPSSPLMGAGCGQSPIDPGAHYFSSLCREAVRAHESSSDGLPDCRAERGHCSRCSSSTGLER